MMGANRPNDDAVQDILLNILDNLLGESRWIVDELERILAFALDEIHPRAHSRVLEISGESLGHVCNVSIANGHLGIPSAV